STAQEFLYDYGDAYGVVEVVEDICTAAACNQSCVNSNSSCREDKNTSDWMSVKNGIVTSAHPPVGVLREETVLA
ncbi:hypothetical protein NPIL_662501, partial [Nephila pilipes]